MRKTGRNALLVALVALLITGLSTVALAASEGGEGGEEGGGAEVTTTTIDSGLTPAVDAAVEEGPPAEVDWTYRYMVPTGLALAALVVLVVSIKYFTDVVRKRYRIVEE